MASASPLFNEDIRRLMRRAVLARFGNERPATVLQRLSDIGAAYTALEMVIEAEKPGLPPATTPEASQQSKGLSEAFVNTLRRAYVDGVDPLCKARRNEARTIPTDFRFNSQPISQPSYTPSNNSVACSTPTNQRRAGEPKSLNDPLSSPSWRRPKRVAFLTASLRLVARKR